MFRYFVGCLGQARKRCSNRWCCGPRNYASDIRPTDPLAVGVESPSQTLAPGVVFCTCHDDWSGIPPYVLGNHLGVESGFVESPFWHSFVREEFTVCWSHVASELSSPKDVTKKRLK